MDSARFPPWPVDGTLGQRFVAQAARRGARPAVIEPGRITTYSELEIWSKHITDALRGAGVDGGGPVGVMVEQGAAQIAAIFGALRANAIYVPLDVALPVSRL